MEVEAKREEHMRIVHIRQPSIMDVLRLPISAHHLGQKIELYDVLDYRWYHPDSKQLWCRLNVGQGLVIRATGVRLTPGLEECLLKVLPERLRPGTDRLPPYLAYTAARTHPAIPIGPPPPLTVMSASVAPLSIPQRNNNMAPSGSGAVNNARAGDDTSRASTRSGDMGTAHPHSTDRRAKRKKRGDGTAFHVPHDVIELSSDDDDPPPAKPVPRDVIELSSDDDNPPPAKPVSLSSSDVIDISNEDTIPTGSKRPRKRILRKATEQQRVDLPPANRPRRRPVTIVISDDEDSGPSSHSQPAQPAATSSEHMSSSTISPLTGPAASCNSAISSGAFPMSGPSGSSSSATRTQGRVTSPLRCLSFGKGKKRDFGDSNDSDGDSDATLV